MKKLISFLEIMFIAAIILMNFVLPVYALPIVSVNSPILETISIRNLSPYIMEEELQGVFSEYGTVKNVSLYEYGRNGIRSENVYVEMVNEADEEAAIEDLDGAYWMGKQLEVKKFEPPAPEDYEYIPRRRY